MLKKTFLLVSFLFFSSCGYEAMHSKKNNSTFDFSISKISLEGDRDFNLEIKQRLNNYTLSKKEKDFTLKIRTTSNKIIIAKNLAGDPTDFKNTITMYVDVLIENSIKKTLIIKENFNYTNNSNKFSLKRYEKDIKSNLAESSAKKLVFKLSNIQ